MAKVLRADLLKFTCKYSTLLDARNVLGVYAYTGSPDDDGYLSSPQGQNALSFQTSAQSYTDLYNVSMANPNLFTLPRRLRLGIRVGF
jgi:hypothetical protein